MSNESEDRQVQQRVSVTEARFYVHDISLNENGIFNGIILCAEVKFEARKIHFIYTSAQKSKMHCCDYH